MIALKESNSSLVTLNTSSLTFLFACIPSTYYKLNIEVNLMKLTQTSSLTSLDLPQ